MPHEILYNHVDVKEDVISVITNMNIDNKDRISKNNNFVIKCFDKNTSLKGGGDTELFLIQKYIENEFTHPHFLNYYSIIQFNEKTNKINESDDYYTKLNTYKTKISPKLGSYNNKKDNNLGVIMPEYQTLGLYICDIDIDPKLLLNNILGILDLSILIRDKYNLIHSDLKVDNIVVHNNIFYLIDWEDAFTRDEMYYHYTRPTYGNTEMYPHYNATAEQFFIYSIGVLIIKIIGYNYEVTYKDFMENITFNYILTKIPSKLTILYEQVLLDIYDKKFDKIEELKDRIKELKDNIKER
jgi:hypothetical protein